MVKKAWWSLAKTNTNTCSINQNQIKLLTYQISTWSFTSKVTLNDRVYQIGIGGAISKSSLSRKNKKMGKNLRNSNSDSTYPLFGRNIF